MNLINRYITKNPYFNDRKWITGTAFNGFFLHSVGCAQPDPLVFIRQWDNASYTNAGISGFIGSEAVYIAAPCLETPGMVKRMPHAGSPANNNYIGFEMCEPASLHYNWGDRFTCSDLAGARAYCQQTYQNAVELFAQLCKFHGKDPLQDGVILSHSEGHKRGIATGHSDPEHLWTQLGLPYTMGGFRRDVKEKMEGEIDMTKDEVMKLIDERITVALDGRDVAARPSLKKELEEAKSEGITDGTRPGGYARRDEVAAMVLRGMKK